MKTFTFLLLCCLCVTGSVLGEEGPRTALVMGVWDYEGTGSGGISFPSLPGIESDVKKMADRLRQLKFDVTVVTNPNLVQARDAIDAFGKKLSERKGTGLFYFSGHGCEQEGKNFLIPRKAAISSKKDLPSEAVFADRVLSRMEEGGAVNLVFLDCCRNALTKSAGDGLAAMQARGVFIGFATASEREANATLDGSPYTTALIKFLGEPGVSITDTHTKVTGEVQRITSELGNKQTPFQYSGLSDVYFLVAAGGTAPAVTTTTTTTPVTPPPPPVVVQITPPAVTTTTTTVPIAQSVWVFADSSSRVLRSDELARLDRDSAWRARNEIFARHGYIFASEKGRALTQALGNFYQPQTDNQDAVYYSFNQFEKTNVDLLKAIENGGSMPPSSNTSGGPSSRPPPPVVQSVWVFADSSSRYLSKQEVTSLNRAMAWRARNEIYARHGYIFSSADGKALARSLGQFYSPVTDNAGAVERRFNAFERANVDLIKAYGAK